MRGLTAKNSHLRIFCIRCVLVQNFDRAVIDNLIQVPCEHNTAEIRSQPSLANEEPMVREGLVRYGLVRSCLTTWKYFGLEMKQASLCRSGPETSTCYGLIWTYYWPRSGG